MVRLPELTAYIDLDVNIPAQEQMSRFFSQKHYIPWIADVLLLINYQNQTMREGLLSISEKKESDYLENQPLSAVSESFDLGWRGAPQRAQTMPNLARWKEDLLKTALAVSSQIEGRDTPEKDLTDTRETKGPQAYIIVNGMSFVPYQEAQARVQTEGIKSIEEYGQWQKTQEDMPLYPNITYKNRGWKNWRIFLGTKQLHRRTFVSYKEAQAHVQHAGIKRSEEYLEWQKNHPDMPFNPNVTYKGKGWINWKKFLGTG